MHPMNPARCRQGALLRAEATAPWTITTRNPNRNGNGNGNVNRHRHPHRHANRADKAHFFTRGSHCRLDYYDAACREDGLMKKHDPPLLFDVRP